MLNLEKIGNKIKNERIRCGISQEDLAEKLFVSRQAVSKWEMGATMPSIDNVCFLVEIFGTSIDELLCLSPDKPMDKSRFEKLTDTKYVLASVKKGEIGFDISDEMYKFSPEDRMIIVRTVKEFLANKFDNPLIRNLDLGRFWVKLTDGEQQFFNLTRYKSEKRSIVLGDYHEKNI